MTPVLTSPTRSIRAAAATAVFFLKVLPMLPSRPVDWLTPAPLVERVRYPEPGGEAEGDLYRPAAAGPHPGVVVCLGVVPFGVDHPQVPRLGAALARAGIAALLYWSPAMRDLRIDPQDAEGIALAYRWLIEQPSIDAGRCGLLGTCVGGSFALLAAADPSIRDRVAFVVAWAPYASMRTLARDISSSTSSSGEAPAPWQVDQLTRAVYVRTLTAVLDPGEAERLRTACAERGGRVDDRDLSAEGRAVYPLLTALDAGAAEAALGRLPAAMRERLDAMSPQGHLAPRSRSTVRIVSWLTPNSAASERRLLVAPSARTADSSTGVSLRGRWRGLHGVHASPEAPADMLGARQAAGRKSGTGMRTGGPRGY